MKRLTDNLDAIIERIRVDFSDKDASRESVLPLCRQVIRHSSNTIRAIHRQEFEQALAILKSARDLLSDIKQTVSAHAELANSGFVRDAQKEFAEANITLALVTGKQLPDPAGLCIDPAPYLNGMGEAVGEMRRYLLDGMRRGDLSRGEQLLSAMDDIYSVLVTIDFPDAITNGLRRTTDMVRGVLERTRSDLTLVLCQKELEDKLG
ncbi:haloacid dehalogenase [Chloroflexota bacterium]